MSKVKQGIIRPLAMGLPVATIHIFNGVILLFVLAGELLTRYRIRLERDAVKG